MNASKGLLIKKEKQMSLRAAPEMGLRRVWIEGERGEREERNEMKTKRQKEEISEEIQTENERGYLGGLMSCVVGASSRADGDGERGRSKARKGREGKERQLFTPFPVRLSGWVRFGLVFGKFVEGVLRYAPNSSMERASEERSLSVGAPNSHIPRTVLF